MTAYVAPRRVLSSATQITVNSAVDLSWLPAPGQYTTASLSTVQGDVSPYYFAGGTFGGTQGTEAIFNTWEGSAFVPTIGELGSMYFWGGGHYAYFGDDFVKYDVATRRFSRAYGVSPYAVTVANPPGVPNDSTYLRHTTDGEFVGGISSGYSLPVPYHTYNSIHYLPQDAVAGSGPLGSIVLAPMCENTGQPVPVPLLYTFNLAAAPNDWSAWTKQFHLASHPNTPGSYGLHSGSCYDSVRKVVWVVSGDTVRDLWRNNLNTGVSTGVTGTFGSYANSFVSEACVAYVPAQDCLINQSQGTTNAQYYGIDLSSSPTATSSTSACTRTLLTWTNPTSDPYYNPGLSTGGQGFSMEVINGIVTTIRVSPTTITIYRMIPPVSPLSWKTNPWTWNVEVVTPKNVGDLTERGDGTALGPTISLFSKMRYVPAIKCILYVYRGFTKMVAVRHSTWT